MWYERGKSAGAVLGDIEKEVSALQEVVTGEVEGKRRVAQLMVECQKADYAALESELDGLDDDLKRAKEEHNRSERERRQATSLFSVPKGVLYLLLAILLLLADVSLLGQVAAEFFNYDWRTRVGGGYQTFSELLFTDPVGAFREFPDLLWLTLAILLMSLFAKLWRDAWDLYDLNEQRWRRFGKGVYFTLDLGTDRHWTYVSGSVFRCGC